MMTFNNGGPVSWCTLAAVVVLMCTPAGQSPPPAAPPPERTAREVAVTFDDLPATHGDLARFRYVTGALLAAIERHRVPAIGFVNERKLFVEGEREARTELLDRWLDAGLELGNHTYSHVAIDQVPFEAYKEDLIRGERVTRGLLAARGKRLRYFRHTQLRTGPTPAYKATLDALLRSRGYVVAPVTVDNNEYVFADVYASAQRVNDRATMARVGGAYVPYMAGMLEHFEQLSRTLLGYEVKQVLLLHANELNADYFDDLAVMIRDRGYRFVTLDRALSDPAFRLPDAQTTRGVSWIARWMMAKGMAVPPEPSEPAFVRELFDTYGRRGQPAGVAPSPCCDAAHSVLSTTSGSTLVARRAGR